MSSPIVPLVYMYQHAIQASEYFEAEHQVATIALSGNDELLAYTHGTKPC